MNYFQNKKISVLDIGGMTSDKNGKQSLPVSLIFEDTVTVDAIDGLILQVSKNKGGNV